MENKDKVANTIVILLTAMSVAIPLFSIVRTSYKEISAQQYIIFIGMILFIVIGFILYSFHSKWSQMKSSIESNTRKIISIKKDINFKELYNNMEKRLSILEALRNSKRGQLDPRLPFIIILSLLLYLFLKSSGFFG